MSDRALSSIGKAMMSAEERKRVIRKHSESLRACNVCNTLSARAGQPPCAACNSLGFVVIEPKGKGGMSRLERRVAKAKRRKAGVEAVVVEK